MLSGVNISANIKGGLSWTGLREQLKDTNKHWPSINPTPELESLLP